MLLLSMLGLDEMMSGIELNELIAKVTGNSGISLLPQMLPQTQNQTKEVEKVVNYESGSKPYNRELWRIHNGVLEEDLVNFVLDRSRQKAEQASGVTGKFWNVSVISRKWQKIAYICFLHHVEILKLIIMQKSDRSYVQPFLKYTAFSDPVRKMSVTLYKEDWTDLVNQLKKKLALIIDNNNKYEWASNINLTHQLCSQKYRKVVRSGQFFPPLVACENVKRMIKASEQFHLSSYFKKALATTMPEI